MSDGFSIASKKHLHKHEHTYEKELHIAAEILRPLQQDLLQSVTPLPLVQLGLPDEKPQSK
jgi:hypothetical protein